MVEGFSRKTGWVAAFAAGAFSAASPAVAQTVPPYKAARGAALYGAGLHAAVSGVVRDRAGRPQVGALVELLNANDAVIAQTWTDERGRYALHRVSAGLYQVRATAELLLPAIRSQIHLLADTRAVVNLTLAGMYAALDWLPAEPRQPGAASDDWDWTLRLATNRPLLRLLPGGPAPPEARKESEVRVRAASGARRFGEAGLTQQVRWIGSSENGNALALGAVAGRGRLGCEAGYLQQFAGDRSVLTQASYTERPEIRQGAMSGLQLARIRSSSTLHAGDLAELTAGTELDAARLGGAALTAEQHPFMEARVHSDAGFVEYRAQTAAETGEDAPRLAAQDGKLRFERGLHQELRAGRRAGKWTGEAALFDDRLESPLLEGAVRGGEASLDGNDVLFDPETGMIAVSGRGYNHGGVLALLKDQLSADTWLSLRFALGESLALPTGTAAFVAQTAPAATVAAGTRLPGAGTAVRGSYRWQPVSTLTNVAPFEDAAPEAYLGFSVRQPLRLKRLGGDKVEAVLDIRNLLAQGYRPFVSQDGAVVFFAQAQRTIAGGVSFTF